MINKINYIKILTLKNNIRSYRKFYGLTQVELANLVCVSKNAISSFERYEYYPSAHVAALLCEVFSCSFEQLFYLDYCYDHRSE